MWLADAACISFSWVLVSALYGVFVGFCGHGFADYLHVWPVVLIYTGINLFARLYHGRASYPAMPVSPVEEFRRLVLSAVMTHLLTMAFLGFGHVAMEISRLVLIASGLLTAVLAQPFRDIARGLMKRLGVGQIRAMLVGTGEVADRVRRALAGNSYFGFDVVPFGGENRDIVAEAKRLDIKILLACQDARLFAAQMTDFVGWFHHIEYLPTAAAFPVADGRVVSVDGVGGLEMVNQARMKGLHVEKSVLDRVLSLIILLLASPCFVVIPILIKLTSRGPVFYRANRLGKLGRPIKVLKFRSMYADADARLKTLLQSDPKLAAEFKANFKLANDPRVTPLGRILRKTSLDEIPQILNVFSGEMMLIGPRPIVEDEVAYYGDAFPVFSSVKPGITGLWQCSGRSGTDYPTRVALDVHYVLNWSPWMDLWIVFRTAIAVLTMKGSC